MSNFAKCYIDPNGMKYYWFWTKESMYKVYLESCKMNDEEPAFSIDDFNEYTG